MATIGRKESLAAVNEEVEYLTDRWLTLGNDPQLGQIQLNDLLQAHDRVLQEEQALLSSMIEFNLAVIELQRAKGTLIEFTR